MCVAKKDGKNTKNKQNWHDFSMYIYSNGKQAKKENVMDTVWILTYLYSWGNTIEGVFSTKKAALDFAIKKGWADKQSTIDDMMLAYPVKIFEEEVNE